jgi:L,D-transpeptidase YcbB
MQISFERGYRGAGIRLVSAVIATLALLTPAAGQQVDELIRARVEQLHATGELDIDGAPIAARNLIAEIYAARAFAPTWHSVAQIDGLLETIEDSYLEGLDPADYHVDGVRAARAAFENADELSAAERAGLDILLTDSVIRLGYHLRFGKVDPVALDSDWNFRRELIDQDPAETIQAAIEAPSMREFAGQVIPRGAAYRRLKQALADYRAIEAAGGWPTLAQGPTLKPGSVDDRVPLLAARLVASGDLTSDRAAGIGTTYSGAIVDGVAQFQARHGLARDGAVGPATLAALNVPVSQRIDQIRGNLERTRWVLEDPLGDGVVVNIAAFRLDLMRHGDIVWTTRVQVGQPYRRTPVFKAEMRYLVFNPTWTVPPTILARDILPQQRHNAGYLASRNIQVIDDGGTIVDTSSVDWNGRRSFPYRFVQQPGPTNALGRVKFMFPNDHFVYLHDTPSRDLFTRESRAFSSGCIRVEEPFTLALALLGSRWNQARIDTLIASGRTETVFLDTPIDVMLLYLTTEVDDTGRVLFLPDVYSRDAAVIAGLGEPFHASARL